MTTFEKREDFLIDFWNQKIDMINSYQLITDPFYFLNDEDLFQIIRDCQINEFIDNKVDYSLFY